MLEKTGGQTNGHRTVSRILLNGTASCGPSAIAESRSCIFSVASPQPLWQAQYTPAEEHALETGTQNHSSYFGNDSTEHCEIIFSTSI